ncbi:MULTISPECIES: hypothetical protein [Ralstonia solanacearum species complex]|uniref:hypothetical protein n=1 Tax=Ralstonia solanacearum species complex TaxID=3116862 RepID=UPI0002C0D72F|nr:MULTISPECIES: hypothetical protein [Ralstonia solanacearum species complex]AGH85993.1 hypothetical protein F504_3483 [Ralstonia pseudosolanacearum FQY_4]ANH31202.1 hypothetical protein A3768_0009 [Ralstonia solanacearum]NKA08713.1 hypothetical protein [Ralstonia solanacearum]
MDDTQRPLKVQIEDAVVVDHIFNALMGGATWNRAGTLLRRMRSWYGILMFEQR